MCIHIKYIHVDHHICRVIIYVGESGFAIITWNNPKKIGETRNNHLGTCYLSIFRGPIFPCNKVLMVDRVNTRKFHAFWPRCLHPFQGHVATSVARFRNNCRWRSASARAWARDLREKKGSDWRNMAGTIPEKWDPYKWPYNWYNRYPPKATPPRNKALLRDY